MANNTLKIFLLFAPPKDATSAGELSSGMIPPIGLVYLGTYLKAKLGGQVELKLADGTLLGYEKSLEQIKEFNPDILGVSFYTPCAFGAYGIINDIKKIKPEILTIGGGPHVTPMYDEALTKCAMDIAVLGEGEETLLEIVKDYLDKGKAGLEQNLNTIKGIAYTDGQGKICVNELRPYIADLDSIPFPDWDLLPLQDYSGWYLKKNKKEAPLMFSRGCPFNCKFCSNAVWKVCKPYIRARSPQNVADEIEMLVKKYGIDEIYDTSDEFNNNNENAIAICREIKKRNLAVAWKSQLRANPLSEELVKAMAEANCWYVNLGIESGNQETLDGIGKMITLDQVIKTLKLLKKYKIKVQGLFMLYNVWEDEQGNLKYEDNFKTGRTLDFARDLVKRGLLDFIGWSVTTPYPGSQLYDIALRHKLIKPELAGKWDLWLKSDRYIMSLPCITVKDQIKMKTKGSLIRFWCIIKSGNFGWKDLLLILKKGFGVLKMNIRWGRRD